MSNLVRIQGPDAPSDVQGERVGRFEVALTCRLAGCGAQEHLRVLEVGRVGNFPLAKGAFPIGNISVDSHHRKMRIKSKACSLSGGAAVLMMVILQRLPSDVLHWGSSD